MSKLETMPTANNNDLDDLTFAVQRMQACIQHSSNAFEGNARSALNELKEVKEFISETIKKLQEPLQNTENDLQSLQEVSRALAVIPEKVAQEMQEFPDIFSESTENSVSNLVSAVTDNLSDRIEKEVSELNNEIMSFIRTYNEEVQAATSKFRGDNDQMHHDLKYELQKYTDGLERVIDRSDRYRVKNMMYTAILCSGLSAVVSALTVWCLT